ncbi:unnamed protein product [Caenorhabditis angaria]|uniref:LisH domain-containing protein n=1 Tax=Caenorhabditis angaria TaxID=860376 RepID=A0A9P1N7Q3_9PELO|nr:unnamed protein product [Caenorhabditis angaria]
MLQLPKFLEERNKARNREIKYLHANEECEKREEMKVFRKILCRPIMEFYANFGFGVQQDNVILKLGALAVMIVDTLEEYQKIRSPFVIMSIRLEDVDSLVYQYLKERGLHDLAEELVTATGLENKDTFDNGLLIRLIAKTLHSYRETETEAMCIERMHEESVKFNAKSNDGDEDTSSK